MNKNISFFAWALTFLASMTMLATASPPSITEVSILPSYPANSENLSSSVSGDDVNITYNWYVDQQSITILNLPMTNASWNPDTNLTYDYSGFGNDGVLGATAAEENTDPTFNTTDCIKDGCYTWGDAGDVIIVLNSDSLNSTGNDPFTISMWVNIIDRNQWMGLFWRPDTSSATAIDLALSLNDVGSKWRLAWYRFGIAWQYSTITVDYNAWQYAAFVYNGTNGIFYTNGVESGFFPMVNLGTNNNNLKIGHKLWGLYPFQGSIDEVMFFNRSLTVEQIQAIYNSGIGLHGNLTVSQETLTEEDWKVSATPIDMTGLNGTTIFSPSVIIDSLAPVVGEFRILFSESKTLWEVAIGTSDIFRILFGGNA